MYLDWNLPEKRFSMRNNNEKMNGVELWTIFRKKSYQDKEF